MDKDVVYLDTLDGAAFEKFCGRIFERLGWGNIEETQYTRDKGIDLIIHSGDGRTIIVECKHQPNNSIGRPVLQKLHSAVISSGGSKGILITTGRFTLEALEHAKTLRPEIELFDRYRLLDLADKAGIRIVTGYKESKIMSYVCSDEDELRKKLLRLKNGKFISHPTKYTDLIQASSCLINFKPTYEIRFDAHQDFYTTVGRIYTIDIKDGFLRLDGVSGNEIDGTVSEFLNSTSYGDHARDPYFTFEINRDDFRIDSVSLVKLAKSLIIKKTATDVSYWGKNNVLYQKSCSLGERSIFLSDIKQVLIPYRSLKINILSRNYLANIVEGNDNLLFLKDETSYCGICSKEIKHTGLICNDCGSIVHAPRIFRKHGTFCKKCKKTICRNCTVKVRSLLLFRKSLCKQCTKDDLIETKK